MAEEYTCCLDFVTADWELQNQGCLVAASRPHGRAGSQKNFHASGRRVAMALHRREGHGISIDSVQLVHAPNVCTQRARRHDIRAHHTSRGHVDRASASRAHFDHNGVHANRDTARWR